MEDIDVLLTDATTTATVTDANNNQTHTTDIYAPDRSSHYRPTPFFVYFFIGLTLGYCIRYFYKKRKANAEEQTEGGSKDTHRRYKDQELVWDPLSNMG